MAGISAETCISLILSRIGGVPLRGASTAILEGSPPAKQIGGAVTSIPGLSAMKDSFSGLSLDAINAKTFTNPISSVAGTLSNTINSSLPNIQSLAGSIDPLTGSFTGGKLSLDQVNALTSKINGSTIGVSYDELTGTYSQISIPGTGGVANALPGLVDHTNKMSGLKQPNYENPGEFGFLQLNSVQTSMTSLKTQIPSDLDKSFGVLPIIEDKVNTIGKPLYMEPDLLFANKSVNDAASLSFLDGAALNANYNRIMNELSFSESKIVSVVSDSKSSMTSLVAAVDATTQISAATGTISSGDTGPAGQTLNKILQPSVKTQIEDGIRIYSVNELNTAQ